jgi:hypothetical protein
MGVLDPEDQKRLVKLLGMLSSDREGERSNAGRMADDLLRKNGLRWDDVIDTPLAIAPSKPQPKPQSSGKAARPRGKKRGSEGWRAVAEVVLQHPYASDWARNFTSDILKRWSGQLTEAYPVVPGSSICSA